MKETLKLGITKKIGLLDGEGLIALLAKKEPNL